MSRRAAPRALVLVFTAALAASQLSTGLLPVAPAATARADTGNYPQFDGNPGIPDQTTFYAAAGVANVATGAGSPNPATVTAQNGGASLQGAALLTSDLSNTQLGATLVSTLRLQTLPVDLPLSTIPLDRTTAPHTWQEMFAGTTLAGIPLQSVTFKQAWQFNQSSALPKFADLVLADVDWSSSVLASLPLSALALGGADLSTVDPGLQPGESASDSNLQRWCKLFNTLRAGSCASSTSLNGQTAIGAALQGAPLKDVPLKDVPLKDVDLSSSPLKDVPLKDVVLGSAPLKDVPLKDVDMANSPLKDVPLKDVTFATSPLKDVPLKDVAWATSPLKDVPLKDVNLTTSPLKDVPLKDVNFDVAPLKDVPLKDVNLSTSPLKDVPLKDVDFSAAPLKDVPLKDVNIAGSPLKDVPLKDVALAGAPLKDVPLKDVDFANAPLKDVPLKDVSLSGLGLDVLPLDQIAWNQAGLRTGLLSDLNLTSGPLSTITLASTANPAAIAACAAAAPSTCTGTETLGSLAAAHQLTGGATLASIGAAAFTGHGTLADLLAARTATSAIQPTLGDLRLDLAGAGAPSPTLAALVDALSPTHAAIVLGDLGLTTMAGSPTLGILRLDLLADTGLTVGGFLALLDPSTPDVTLGDLRLDLMANAPALTLADFLASLPSAVADGLTLGDLRLDAATGVDALVLNAITGFLLVPTALDTYLLGAIGAYTTVTGHDITLGELGTWKLATGADITLGQLAQYLDDSVSLSDVLLGLVPASLFPFENFPVSSLGLDSGLPIASGSGYIAPPQNTYTIPIFNTGSTPTDPMDLLLNMPAGAKSPSVLLINNGPAVIPTSTIERAADGTENLRVNLPPILLPTPSNAFARLRVSWRTGLSLQGNGIYAQIFFPGTTDSPPYDNPYDPFTPYAFAFDLHPVSDASEPNSPTDTANPGDGAAHAPVLLTNPNGCSSTDTDCTGKAPVYIDDLVPSFIGHDSVMGPPPAGVDVDWYRLPNVRAGSRITADLTNLPVDADLVLYAPAGTNISPTVFPSSQFGLPGALIEDPALGVGSAAQALSAQALNDLNLDKGYTDATTHQVVPPLTPVSISQHRGTDNESVGIVAPVSGTYTIAVSGYTAAGDSAHPYLLRARVTTPAPDGTCTARTGFDHSVVGTAPSSIPSNANAIILTNMSRLAATYPNDYGKVTDGLDALTTYLSGANATGVVPVVVPIDAYADVQAAYANWDANPCSVTAANGVAKAITGVIASIRASNPSASLTSVTLVGGDDIIPMGRVPDLTRISNEAEYASTFGDTLNPIAAAQAGSYTLTDDLYGDTSPTSLGDAGSLFVPRMAVGRLVETPAEIGAQLTSFGHNDGVLDTHSALVAGYDFLSDGATAVADRLDVNGRTVNRSLIDTYDTAPAAAWTRQSLLSQLFPGSSAAPLVDSINAHYSHNALLSSAGNATPGSDAPITTSDIRDANTADQLRGRVLFTMGCHAGLAVPDSYIAGTGTAADKLRLDWAQELSQAGVSVYVANTGFGIGDTASVAYTERLMGLYARLLDGTLTAGQALEYAKQAYYGSLGAVGVYDLKILQQTEFYGLPFWHLTTADPATAAATAATASIRLASATPTLTTDPSTGLQAQDLAFDQSGTGLKRNDGPRGTYWTVGDEAPQVVQYRPVQPQTSRPVTVDGLQAHGALITSLSSRDETVNPAIAMPTANQAGATGEASSSDLAWPSKLATVTNFASPGGAAQNVVLVAGQFQGTSAKGLERLYDTAGVRVLYADPSVTDFTEPVITSFAASGSGSTASFGVQASDAAGPLKRVLVGFRDFNGSWQFVDLQSSDGLSWSGSGTTSRPFAGADVVSAFVQVVDAAGNIAVASGKAAWLDTRVPDGTAPTITASVSPAPVDGWIRASSATVTFTCDDGDGSGVASCPLPVTVAGDGSHDVSGTATDMAGNASSTSLSLKLDGTKPTITASVDPAGWSNAATASVTFTCSDGESGLAANACPTPVTVSAEQTTTVTRSVTDIAGNTATATATVKLDRTAPTISAQVLTTPNAAGWFKANVSIQYTCSDGWNTLPAGACPGNASVTADGVSQVKGTVTDAAGNSTTITTTVRLDKTAPVVAITGTAPQFTCTTTDALSGVAKQATLSSGTQRVNGIPMTTASCSGALDAAGNSGSAVSGTAYVAKITFGGFLSPVDAPPMVNTGPAGKTFPVKFKLTGVDGLDISTLAAVTSTTYKSVSCTSMTGTEDPLTTVSASASGLVYDSVAKQYVYTWKTPSTAGCYVFTLTLADKSTYTANFKLK